MSAEALAPVAADSHDPPAAIAGDGPKFELRFTALFNPGRGYAFPCDAQGRVRPGHSERNRPDPLLLCARDGGR